MKPAILLLAVALCAHAQAPAAKPSEQTNTTSAPQVDAKLHASVVKLVELSGVKQTVESNFPQIVEEGKKKMMEYCKTCSPEFGDEWAKRMLARLKVDDFLEVYVRVYEKYLTEEDVTELLDLQMKKKSSPPPSPSPRLKQKLTSVMPSVLGDAMGGCAQIGAKLGAEIGDQIAREHPEYVPQQPGKQQ